MVQAGKRIAGSKNMTDTKVEREFQTASKWKGEAQLLRSILLSCDLIETFKFEG